MAEVYVFHVRRTARPLKIVFAALAGIVCRFLSGIVLARHTVCLFVSETHLRHIAHSARVPTDTVAGGVYSVFYRGWMKLNWVRRSAEQGPNGKKNSWEGPSFSTLGSPSYGFATEGSAHFPTLPPTILPTKPISSFEKISFQTDWIFNYIFTTFIISNYNDSRLCL